MRYIAADQGRARPRVKKSSIVRPFFSISFRLALCIVILSITIVIVTYNAFSASCTTQFTAFVWLVSCSFYVSKRNRRSSDMNEIGPPSQ